MVEEKDKTLLKCYLGGTAFEHTIFLRCKKNLDMVILVNMNLRL